ncbi:hypothetical protein CRG98_010870 [Punica granatum]|uniref:Transmembrane protein n=1 Tax=Punica granatum TaxID=22663 RepID=A0A2I0KKV2_PUNGR|nr:hypothetical protein CRG98_010870 [Punica granatum]
MNAWTKSLNRSRYEERLVLDESDEVDELEEELGHMPVKNEEMRHIIPQTPMRTAVRTLFVTVQLALLVVIGLRYWKRKTVPAGRSLIRSPRDEKTVELEELLEDDDELVVVEAVVLVPVVVDFGIANFFDD